MDLSGPERGHRITPRNVSVTVHLGTTTDREFRGSDAPSLTAGPSGSPEYFMCLTLGREKYEERKILSLQLGRLEFEFYLKK